MANDTLQYKTPMEMYKRSQAITEQPPKGLSRFDSSNCHLIAIALLPKLIDNTRAAFENVSRVRLTPLSSGASLLDIRTARLPSGNLPDPDQNTFDPRKHRDPKKPISPAMAYFNILRSMFGAGMLGLPLAVSQAGIVLGPILCVFIGCLILHTHLTLLQCLNEISRQLKIPHISYRYGFRVALLHGPRILKSVGEYGPCVIALFMVLSQLGICSVIIIFTADSLRDMMDWSSNTPALLCLFVPYLLLEFLMKDLKIVSYVTLAGNFLGMIGLVMVFYHIFNEPHGEVIKAKTDPLSLLFAIGTFLFNMSLVGVVLSLDKALLHPEILVTRGGALVVGVSIATVVCTIFGSLGYWSFGTMEENILRSLPFDDITSIIIIGLYLIAIALSYPLQCYPGVQIMLEVIKNMDYDDPVDEGTLKWVEYVGRPTFVVLSFIVSYIVALQGPFVAFVGNLCTTLLSLVFPALMELCLLYPGNYGKYHFYLFKNIFLIVLATISWGFGIIFSIKNIYVRILVANSPNEYANV